MFKPVVFGKFCLLERISVGGMAEVYRAKPMDTPSFDKFLAIKKILPNLAQDDEFISMFIDEAKIAVQLSHRNICQIYELGRLDDSHFIVMEFISGRDVLAIQNRMRRDKRIMSVGQGVYLARQIAEGLDAAHRKRGPNGDPLNIIHRDISPQNIIVSYTGEVKVIDFGIAKAASRSNKTQVGVLKGKFGYMSPEQVRGLDLDRRSDIFALGTLFHEMLTCRRLFHGESDFAILEKVRSADVPPPSKYNPNIPPSIDAVVLKALAPEPDDRFQTCAEMADELDTFLAKLRPPYTERTLEGWMQKTFTSELAKERTKRQFFARFKTVGDVKHYQAEVNADIHNSLGTGDDEAEPEPAITNEKTMIWDSEADEARPAGEMGDMATRITDGLIMDDSAPALPEIAMPQNFVVTSPTHAPPTGSFPAAPARRGGGALTALKVVVVGGLFLFAFAGVAIAGYVLLFGSFGGSAAATSGALVLTSRPVEDVEIMLNGELRATKTPIILNDLAAGTYTIEARHGGYLPATKLVRLRRGDRTAVELVLEPRPVGHGTLKATIDPPDGELYVDGERRPSATLPIKLDDRRAHLVEVRRLGYFPGEWRIEVSDGQKLEKELKLQPIIAEIELDSTPRGVIYLNGGKVGRTPMKLERLDPFALHEIEIRAPGHAPWYKKVLFDRSHKKTFSAKLKRGRDDATPADQIAVGFVTVTESPSWWNVEIAGFKTGRVTPIPRSKRLILPVGAHELSFVRGDQKVTRHADVKKGQTIDIVVADEFKW